MACIFHCYEEAYTQLTESYYYYYLSLILMSAFISPHDPHLYPSYEPEILEAILHRKVKSP